MKLEIKTVSGAVAFTADIACDESTTHSVRLGLAARVAIAARADLRGAHLTGANLYGAYLRGADLTGANLYGAYLRGADLTGASLRESNLSGADLRGADLRGADLRGAHLTGADLYGANLFGANLRGANLRGDDLYGVDLRGADLRGADLRGADLYGAKIRELLASVDRSDGYRFLLFSFEGREPTVVAGCRFFTVAAFRGHVAAQYPGTAKARATLRILDYFDAVIAQECGE